MRTSSFNSGFTLLELSIVLVIIGLIIGGVTVGTDLIRSAELNATVSEIKQYQIALNTFKLKYNAIPGDMDNATAYWGTDSNGCPANGATGVCNGDADKRFDYAEGNSAWEHLSESGILPGGYTGETAVILGKTLPASKISGAGFRLYYKSWGPFGPYPPPTYNKNYLGLSTLNSSGSALSGAVLSPQEAQQIDRKIDDGKSNQGKTVAFNGDNASGNCISAGDYDLSNDGIACTLEYLILGH